MEVGSSEITGPVELISDLVKLLVQLRVSNPEMVRILLFSDITCQQ